MYRQSPFHGLCTGRSQFHGRCTGSSSSFRGPPTAPSMSASPTLTILPPVPAPCAPVQGISRLLLLLALSHKLSSLCLISFLRVVLQAAYALLAQRGPAFRAVLLLVDLNMLATVAVSSSTTPAKFGPFSISPAYCLCTAAFNMLVAETLPAFFQQTAMAKARIAYADAKLKEALQI